jgi:HEAT repeat protein
VLRAGSPVDQEQAATRLEALACKTRGTESRNAVQPFLVRLLTESGNPGVRSAAMCGLAAIWDYECVPRMLDLLDDPSPQVRNTAAESVAKLIDVRFDVNAPTDQRASAAKKLREMWNNFQARSLKSWQRRLEEKDKQL